MLVSKIIHALWDLYEKGVPSDDSRLSERYIFNDMVSLRARLLKQQSHKKQKITQWNYQTLPCVEFIKAPPNECPCVPPVGCEIYRSKHPLPGPITGIDSHLIQSLTSLDGTVKYNETTWEEKRFKSGNKYTANTPDFFVRNGYLFLTTNKLFNRILPVTGLFEDPMEVWNFEGACSTEESCLPYMDREFPLDLPNVDTMKLMLKEQLLGPFVQMREDKTNNTSDSPDQEAR